MTKFNLHKSFLCCQKSALHHCWSQTQYSFHQVTTRHQWAVSLWDPFPRFCYHQLNPQSQHLTDKGKEINVCYLSQQVLYFNALRPWSLSSLSHCVTNCNRYLLKHLFAGCHIEYNRFKNLQLILTREEKSWS